jgi:hypothetical protein
VSDRTREKMRQAKLGHVVSADTKEKMRQAGLRHWALARRLEDSNDPSLDPYLDEIIRIPWGWVVAVSETVL